MGFTLDIDKPKPFENRELRAEKTGSKKLKLHQRIFQNTFTHYNYFFNANNKLNEVLTRAKVAHVDDYGRLLPFYNYTLAATAGEKEELDSVIFKAKTGIVLHDLRNDWIDDLYLLWGTAYYLQQQFDSAYQMFQFINYAFAEKDEGYYRYIGSRMDGNTTGSVVTKEDFSFPKGLIADPPSRNNALVWQVRTLIQSGAMAEAGSLMALLKTDPDFPQRLNPALEEVQAYWYYVQQRWDSAAAHLELALDAAGTRQEKARWEYLIGQLYEKAAQHQQAETYYNKAIAHTTDPIMDIYARLNLIRINKEGGDNYIDQNIGALLKMARRDKYVDYRDVIYYMAAQMELERNNYAKAQEYFLLAAKYKSANMPAGNQGFLHLADLYFSQKDYVQAARFYDSVQVQDFETGEAERIAQRQNMLRRLVSQVGVVERQDSLQRIAALPEKEKETFIRNMVRQLRRQQGLKEEGSAATVTAPITSAGQTDLFAGGSKGEWYFYNDKIKAQGAAAFQQQWGNRPNTDNWRRSGNVVAQMRSEQPNNTRGNPQQQEGNVELLLTYEGLMANLPATPEDLQASNDSIVSALYLLGRMYINDLEDYEAAVKTYEELRRRFPGFEPKDEVLFQLYHGYTRLGNGVKADEVKALLTTEYQDSRFARILNTGVDPESSAAPAAATKAYEGVYNLYIEGKFAEAQKARKVADSLYNTTYWSPQLLYIEAVYHIQQRQDSLAKALLNTIVQQNGGTPMADKAATMYDVLSRRVQIEEELRNLQIERPAEEKQAVVILPQKPLEEKKEVVVIPEKPKEEEKKEDLAVTRTTQVAKDTTISRSQPVTITDDQPKTGVDTVAAPVNKTVKGDLYTYNPATSYYAVVVLNKVDVVFGNEARNAFSRYHREKYNNIPLQTTLQPLTEDDKLLLVGEFPNVQAVIDYLQKAKPVAASEIMPWLKADKYTFTLISADNLKILQEKADLATYQKFLDQNLPVKF